MYIKKLKVCKKKLFIWEMIALKGFRINNKVISDYKLLKFSNYWLLQFHFLQLKQEAIHCANP
jgi:hypothetical protein